MKKHHELVKNGLVSVWVGSAFDSEDDCICYVDDGGFSADFGFTLNPAAGRELIFEEEETPVQDLTNGFSYWKSFSDPVTIAAEKKRLTRANVMLVVYNLKYQPELANPSGTRLTFVGVFPYRDERQAP